MLLLLLLDYMNNSSMGSSSSSSSSAMSASIILLTSVAQNGLVDIAVVGGAIDDGRRSAPGADRVVLLVLVVCENNIGREAARGVRVTQRQIPVLQR
jgi:hypothetical protein